MSDDIKIFDQTSSPGPLGFIGLGLPSVILGLQGLGIIEEPLSVISMAIFLGGFAQLFAGLQFWKKGDTFSAVAFTTFALFWFSFAWILIAPFGAAPLSGISSAVYLILWGIYAVVMTAAAVKTGVKSVIATFVFLDLTFILTGLSAAFPALPAGAGAVAAVILGICAMYTGLAMVLESVGLKVAY